MCQVGQIQFSQNMIKTLSSVVIISSQKGRLVKFDPVWAQRRIKPNMLSRNHFVRIFSDAEGLAYNLLFEYTILWGVTMDG